MKAIVPFLFAAFYAIVSARADHPVFVEHGGIVAIEAESTGSRLGRWDKKTDVKGYSGECHLEFTGNKPESGPADSPLKYRFKINKPGKYQLILRARKRLISKRDDICNDCYVRMKGEFEKGGDASLKVLREDQKMFGGNPDDWGWATRLDVDHIKYEPIYQFNKDEEYELTISGRSKNFNIDRLLLVHESHNLRKVQNDNPKESRTEGGLAQGPQRVQRTLINREGKAIQAELIETQGDSVVILFRGRKVPVKIDTLSNADQKFIKAWAAGDESQ